MKSDLNGSVNRKREEIMKKRILDLDELKKEGKKKMNIKDFLNGSDIREGNIVG